MLFRTKAGEVVALDDRCSHRGFPLSAGALVDDEVQCGYHGLRFDACGTCVWAPGQDRIPTKANVAQWPIVENSPWIWAWMGDPADVDHDALPATPWFSDDLWATVDGMEPLPARYGLLIDNLLDLSHETFLHAGFIGTPRGRRNSDRRVAPAGSEPQADGSDPDAVHVKVLYAITPVDDHATLDFWAVSRDFAIDDAEVDEFMAKMNREVVLQDVEALALIEQRLGDNWKPDEVSFKIDTGGIAARRILAQLTAVEG